MNTIKAIRKFLTGRGVNAETLGDMELAEKFEELASVELANKSNSTDLELKNELTELKAELPAFKAELTELKAELTELKTKLEDNISDLSITTKSMQTNIERVENELSNSIADIIGSEKTEIHETSQQTLEGIQERVDKQVETNFIKTSDEVKI